MTVMQLLVPLEDDSGSVPNNIQRHRRQEDVVVVEGNNNNNNNSNSHAVVSSASSSCNSSATGNCYDEGRRSRNANEDASDRTQDLHHHDSISSSASARNHVLSDELREKFETMKSVWRHAKRASNGNLEEQEDVVDGQDPQEVGQMDPHEEDHDDGQPSQRVRLGSSDNSSQDLKRKAREMAVQTALAVAEEIARWQNGIADLEALLAAEEQEGRGEEDDDVVDEELEEDAAQVNALGVREVVVVHHQQQNHPRRLPLPEELRFPVLPPVVPTDDGNIINGHGDDFNMDVGPPTSTSNSTMGEDDVDRFD